MPIYSRNEETNVSLISESTVQSVIIPDIRFEFRDDGRTSRDSVRLKAQRNGIKNYADFPATPYDSTFDQQLDYLKSNKNLYKNVPSGQRSIMLNLAAGVLVYCREDLYTLFYAREKISPDERKAIIERVKKSITYFETTTRGSRKECETLANSAWEARQKPINLI